MVSYRETVTAESDRVCLAKTSNKHCRIMMTAAPLPDGLTEEIEEVGMIIVIQTTCICLQGYERCHL